MPIDDKLGDLEGEEKKKEPVKDSNANESPNTLVAKAREVVGEYLVAFFEGNLPGQRKLAKIDDCCTEIIKKVGLDLFKISPKKSGNEKTLVPYFASDLDYKQIRDLVEIICGEYVFETDLTDLATKERFEELINVLPEFQILKENLHIDDEGCYENRYRATLYPLTIIMGMSSKHKPLAVLAAKSAKDKKQVCVLDNELEQRSPIPVERTLISMAPQSNHYLEAAKEYGVKEIAAVMKDFKSVCQEYIKQWDR